ncbi:POTEH isoform 2, partial [Pongo abelii]
AIQCQEEECVMLLLQHDTDPNLPDVYGNATLHYLVYNEDKSMAEKLLLYGAGIDFKNKTRSLFRRLECSGTVTLTGASTSPSSGDPPTSVFVFF